MTTAEVCKKFIMPVTHDEKISYVELLHRRGAGNFVRKATVFVSHAWSYIFLTVVDTIIQKCQDEGWDENDCATWFDIFAVNQHSGIEDFGHWADSFKFAIRKIGSAWIILIPYRSAVWLSRSWCLFEFWALVDGTVPFKLLLPFSEQELFTQFLTGGGKVEDVISDIDIRKAGAFKKSDQDSINDIVAATVGHQKLNELLTTEFRKWLVESGESALKTISNENERLTGPLHLNIVRMYVMLGRLSDADSELAVRIQKQDGKESLALAESLCEMGIVQWKLGRLEVALAVLTKAQGICPESELELIGNITNRLGTVLDDQGKYSEALSIYQKSLDFKARCFGIGHVSSASTRVNIGLVYNSLGDYEKALFEYNMALPVLEAALGPSHVSVAETYNNMGLVFQKLGDYERHFFTTRTHWILN